MLKMYELINAGNSKVLKNLSIFINKAFELRNSTIYEHVFCYLCQCQMLNIALVCKYVAHMGH